MRQTVKPSSGDKRSLRPQYFPPMKNPLGQRPHAQLLGDGECLILLTCPQRRYQGLC
jgi:hypothetical protein